MIFIYTRLCILFFIGLANALPIPLSGSILSIWLSEAGFDNEVIGLYALLALPFSVKYLWSMPVNFLTIPLFRCSPRKGWLLFSLAGMSTSFFCMGLTNPSHHPIQLAVCLFFLSLFAGCLYIVGLSYELESIDEKEYSLGSAFVITGYRVGLLFAGAGALYLSYLWNWSSMFFVVASMLIVGSLIVLRQPEPYKSAETLEAKRKKFSRYPSFLQGFWHEMIIQPCKNFLLRNDWKMILIIIITFKLGDHFVKSMSGPFYLSLGFNKADLALAAKIWGFAATILGTFTAGYYFKGKDPMKACAITSLIHASTLSCYFFLSLTGKSFYGLYLTVAIENFTAGLSMTTFILLLWRVCDKAYAPLQYALLWSLFSFKSDILAFFGGFLASLMSWHSFFLIIFLLSTSSAIIIYQLTSNYDKRETA